VDIYSPKAIEETARRSESAIARLKWKRPSALGKYMGVAFRLEYTKGAVFLQHRDVAVRVGPAGRVDAGKTS
jgi:hypothetical protein